MYDYVLLCTIMDYYVLLCTIMCDYVLLCTIMYEDNIPCRTHCITVLSYHCITALLYHCTIVSLHYYRDPPPHPPLPKKKSMQPQKSRRDLDLHPSTFLIKFFIKTAPNQSILGNPPRRQGEKDNDGGWIINITSTPVGVHYTKPIAKGGGT